mmetsp:Transcript_60871/g.128801  ORF Transcript_60871/g.128801 Transcript_60871/m.128801 type:complete len:245 (-) Transcript_60871:357-1091(-)
MLARDSHVVGVSACPLVGQLRHHVADLVGEDACGVVQERPSRGVFAHSDVAGVDGCEAGGSHELHQRPLTAVDHSARGMTTLRLGAGGAHFRVPLVLLLWIRESVADGEAGEGDLGALSGLVSLPDTVADGRDIVAGVGLAEDVEVVGLVLREGLEEVLKEGEHVLGHTSFVVRSEASGKTDAGRLIHPHDVGVVVPGVGVRGCGLAILGDLARSIFREERELRGAARAAGEPHDQGIFARVSL